MEELPMKKTMTQPFYTLPYSLHDMYLTKMEKRGETFLCHFPGGIIDTTPPFSQTESACVCFRNVDWDSSFVYLIGGLGNTGTFTVEKIELLQFLPYLERLEILDETYGYWQAKWKGLLTRGDDLTECMVEICYSGEMVYEVER